MRHRFVPSTESFDTIAELPAAERTSDPQTMHAYPRNRVYGIGRDRIYLGDTGSDTILAMSLGGELIAALPVPLCAACGGPRGPGLGDGLSAVEGVGASGRSDPSENLPPSG